MLLRLARFFSSMLSQFLKKLVALHPEIQKFFESPEGQKEFEEWKAQRAKETEKERSV